MTLCGWKIFSKNKHRTQERTTTSVAKKQNTVEIKNELSTIATVSSSPSPSLLSLKAKSLAPTTLATIESPSSSSEYHLNEELEKNRGIQKDDSENNTKKSILDKIKQPILSSLHVADSDGSGSSCSNVSDNNKNKFSNLANKQKQIIQKSISILKGGVDKNFIANKEISMLSSSSLSSSVPHTKTSENLEKTKENVLEKRSSIDDDIENILAKFKRDSMKEDDNDEDYGNPRNKCALKPGHSLIDWIRLGSSGCDLSGTKGVIRPVGYNELQLHCKKQDAWLAIRGKVYNVTRYMDFHPGGPDELMKGVGKDATKLFEEIHAWVNYEQLLSKCYIGPLQNIVTLDLGLESPTKLTKNMKNKLKSSEIDDNNQNIFKTPFGIATKSNSSSSSSSKNNSIICSPEKLNTNTISNLSLSDSIKAVSSSTDDIQRITTTTTTKTLEVVPRFDWIQKTADLTLLFYTKSFCNPGVIIICKNNMEFDARIIIERSTYLYRFQLLHEIKWPGFVKCYIETGKIEIIFTKLKPKLWTNYGQMNIINDSEKYDELNLNYEIIDKEQITYDSYALCLRSCDKTIMITPIGFHLSVTALINDNHITRSYTPVPVNYVSMNCSYTCIPLLVKSYSNGILSKHITNLPLPISSSSSSPASNNKNLIASSVTTEIPSSSSSSLPTTNPIINSSNLVLLSQPKGNFILKKLLDHNRVGFLAAGSGLTPILSVLNHVLARSTNRVESILLLFFNKTEDDIWCRQKLESIALKDARLTIRHILSEPNKPWNGEIGRVSKDLLAPLNNPKSTNYITYCCVCGPTPFNDLCQEIFKDIDYKLSNLHFFQG